MLSPAQEAFTNIICHAVRFELRAIRAHTPAGRLENTLLFFEQKTKRLDVIGWVEIGAAGGISPTRLLDQAMQRAQPHLARWWPRLFGAAVNRETVFQLGTRGDTTWLNAAHQEALSQAIPAALAPALRKARTNRGLTRAQLSALLPSHLNPSTIAGYESTGSGVRVTRLVELCCALSHPPGDVIEAMLQTTQVLLASAPAKAPRGGRRRTWTDKEAEQVAKKYEKGMSIVDLTHDTGRSFGTVRTMILSTGTPLRPWGGASRRTNGAR